ncbi:MAG: MBL fold metallo-hydrolase, partial [Euryarchaeota archaeon]|nr:MBL fold metallo-hydrolase [Euryarchaeota archaeon]
MTRSDWGDWLVCEIEDSAPDGVAIWYLGCNGFVLKASDGTTLFIDPYFGTGDPPRTVRMIPAPFDPEDVSEADALLVTHEHTDHVHGESQAPILENTGATMYAPEDSLRVAREEEAWHEAWDVSDEQFLDVHVGERHEIGSFTINVEPANDPDASQPVSYVIEHESGTFFHGGDARPGEFEPIGEEYDIDLGVLAFGTVGTIPDKETGEKVRTKWYSNETQIIEGANDLRLDRLLPSHWDMWRGLTADPKNLHHHAA